MVIYWLMKEVIKVKPTCNNKHKALIKLGSDIKENLVVVLELKAVVLHIEDHPSLLLIKELPDLKNILQMLSGHFIEVSLKSAQLLLVLFFQHLKVEVQESLNFRSVFGS